MEARNIEDSEYLNQNLDAVMQRLKRNAQRFLLARRRRLPVKSQPIVMEIAQLLSLRVTEIGA